MPKDTPAFAEKKKQSRFDDIEVQEEQIQLQKSIDIAHDKYRLNMLVNESLANNFTCTTNYRNEGSRGIGSHNFDIDEGDNVKIMNTKSSMKEALQSGDTPSVRNSNP